MDFSCSGHSCRRRLQLDRSRLDNLYGQHDGNELPCNFISKHGNGWELSERLRPDRLLYSLTHKCQAPMVDELEFGSYTGVVENYQYAQTQLHYVTQ